MTNIDCIIKRVSNIHMHKMSRDKLANHFLVNILQYTLPHLIIENKNNTHLVVDKLNNRVHYTQLYYNLHLNEKTIKENIFFLMKNHRILERQFNNYEVRTYTLGSGFYTKSIIPHNIKTLHRENYDKLLGVNEYLTNVGCHLKFKSSRDYKSCFVVKDFFDNVV